MRRSHKGFVLTDSSDGFIEKADVTAANKAEGKQLEKMVEDRKQGSISTDKDYAPAENRKLLKNKKLKDEIMSKASQGKPLSLNERLRKVHFAR